MAGKLIVDTIDTDNAFITLNVQQSTIATMNVSGIYSNTGVKMIGANGSVSNTAITGVITGSQLASNTVSNTNIQTGAVENYMNAAGLGFGMRNRIINGAMVIDQRNAGASVSVTSGVSYTLDRWQAVYSQNSKFSVQQNAGSITPPVGFTNYLGCTSSSAYSVGAGDFFALNQTIEGFNFADCNWGTANAKTVTLSAWVYSSLTGTFGGSLRNSASNRSYPFTYSIPVANTWTQVSITIAGDTTGTWIGATNGVGLSIFFSLGGGATYAGTAGSWSSNNYVGATGQTSVVGTNGATFYITGVQLEKGSTATSFDYRPYGTELQLCQRYFETSMSVAPADNMSVAQTGVYAVASSAATPLLTVQFKVTKRADPTVTYYAPLTVSPSGKVREDATGTGRTVTGGATTNWGSVIGVSSGTSSVVYQFGYQASSEL